MMHDLHFCLPSSRARGTMLENHDRSCRARQLSSSAAAAAPGTHADVRRWPAWARIRSAFALNRLTRCVPPDRVALRYSPDTQPGACHDYASALPCACHDHARGLPTRPGRALPRVREGPERRAHERDPRGARGAPDPLRLVGHVSRPCRLDAGYGPLRRAVAGA